MISIGKEKSVTQQLVGMRAHSLGGIFSLHQLAGCKDPVLICSVTCNSQSQPGSSGEARDLPLASTDARSLGNVAPPLGSRVVAAEARRFRREGA